jgi:DNA-binding FrmR family transcriptional regulator
MEYNKQTKNRLKRIEGQVRGVLKMMDENQDCEKVINQLTAICSAVNHTIGVIVTENLKICLLDQMADENRSEELIKEAVNYLVRSNKK